MAIAKEPVAGREDAAACCCWAGVCSREFLSTCSAVGRARGSWDIKRCVYVRVYVCVRVCVCVVCVCVCMCVCVCVPKITHIYIYIYIYIHIHTSAHTQTHTQHSYRSQWTSQHNPYPLLKRKRGSTAHIQKTGLARAIYMQSMYGIFGREITKYTVYGYGV